MIVTDFEIEKLKEALALAEKRRMDAAEHLKEADREFQQAEKALEQALNPEFALTGSD